MSEFEQQAQRFLRLIHNKCVQNHNDPAINMPISHSFAQLTEEICKSYTTIVCDEYKQLQAENERLNRIHDNYNKLTEIALQECKCSETDEDYCVSCIAAKCLNRCAADMYDELQEIAERTHNGRQGKDGTTTHPGQDSS